MTLSGGPIFWILIIMAIASVMVFFERFFELRRAQIDYQDFIEGVVNILSGGTEDEALSICEDTVAPVASIVATAIRHRNGSATALREAVDSQRRAEASRLDRRLASLAIMGQVAPLIGLLGTIIGFIRTVMLVNSQELIARADLTSVAMEALVSAALGLIVAIPVIVMYSILRVRMDRIVVELDAAASQIESYLLADKEAS